MQRFIFVVTILLASMVSIAQPPQPSDDVGVLLPGPTTVPTTLPTTEPPTTAPAVDPTTVIVAEPSMDPKGMTYGSVTHLPTHPTTRPVPGIERAVIISIDGLRPDLLLRADTPNMHRLFESGSYSFWARTTAQSVTLPSHTSMLTGAIPIHHGIEWNRDLPLLLPIYPSVPTIFELAHRVGYTTAMVSGKSKFGTLAKPNTLDWVFIPDATKIDDAMVAREAVKIILAHKPQILFVHFPTVDNVGHAKGWGTPAQIKAIESADEALGHVLDALTAAGVMDNTFILLTADHGGAGRFHGPDDARSRHIPWIAVGPGIHENLDLTTYPKLVIDTEDTCCTVCWLMGIPNDPRNFDGKPITEIVQKNELLHDAKP